MTSLTGSYRYLTPNDHFVCKTSFWNKHYPSHRFSARVHARNLLSMLCVIALQVVRFVSRECVGSCFPLPEVTGQKAMNYMYEDCMAFACVKTGRKNHVTLMKMLRSHWEIGCFLSITEMLVKYLISGWIELVVLFSFY